MSALAIDTAAECFLIWRLEPLDAEQLEKAAMEIVAPIYGTGIIVATSQWRNGRRIQPIEHLLPT